MIHQKLETVEQLEEEFVLYQKELAGDGHPDVDERCFCEVMWEWELDNEEGAYRLDDIVLVAVFLQKRGYTQGQIKDILRWILEYH